MAQPLALALTVAQAPNQVEAAAGHIVQADMEAAVLQVRYLVITPRGKADMEAAVLQVRYLVITPRGKVDMEAAVLQAELNPNPNLTPTPNPSPTQTQT